MEPISERVKGQYEKYPYPKISWLGKIVPESFAHASFEVGAALTRKQKVSHDHKSIALLGCGTAEPLAFAGLHKRATITAVDFSLTTIKQAHRRAGFSRIKNLEFARQDLVEFCSQNPERFDFVHCYGVLHHLADPQKGFAGIKKILKTDGFARIMVYSQTSRRRIRLLAQTYKQLGITAETPDAVTLAQNLIRLLPDDHPLKLTFQNHPESQNRNGVVDAFLNAHETGFTLSGLKRTLRDAGLYIQAWDFSQTILNLLEDAPGEALSEKINFLEAFDQWPSSFTFWVTPISTADNSLAEKRRSLIVKNPHLVVPISGKIESAVLRKQIILQEGHRKILSLCGKNPVPKKEFLVHQDALDELLSARIVLEVAGLS